MKRLHGLLAAVAALVAMPAAVAGTDGVPHSGATAPPSPELSSERRGIGLTAPTASGREGAPIDPFRSLAVTDLAILEKFTFLEVMTAATKVVGNTMTPLQSFQQWWDTQNLAPGLALGPHCDDQRKNGVPVFNGFAFLCPRAEGDHVNIDPFDPGPTGFMPIGLFNRFDLAPADGSDCGEYRILFARRSGQNIPFFRNLLIFEAVLPNPRPELGLNGCARVAEFWGKLSEEADAQVRATRLHDFYFKGLPGFPPVVAPNHYGAGPKGRGQVRTNQFMQFPWNLREFKLARVCDSAVQCSIRFMPATDKTNPAATLFNGTNAQSQNFQQDFVANQVARLAVPDINLFSFAPPNKFNTGQSLSQTEENDYSLAFLSAPAAFRSAIQDKLDQLGSPLSPDQIVARAQTLSCGGCHELSRSADIGHDQTFPASVGFVHVAENQFESGPDGTRFMTSPALKDVFLPHRKNVLEAFLSQTAELPRCAMPCTTPEGTATTCQEICVAP
ncbi:hypothetical protein [Tahibacter amnicola]|uniref:Cytochrome c domain-containing protein n=1 Tax=Tahibacter amnicola TaxID=2976241 RepID=A0ABY6BM68_9GAMM|nr:hypothetical protein [Tahibacter amnicola]UXI70145.1 hypothetical protein N4264_11090 [Tahibacter amnicola]